MKDFGYYVEDDIMVCVACSENPLYKGLLSVAEEEGYPDGFTCADCGTVVGYKGGTVA